MRRTSVRLHVGPAFGAAADGLRVHRCARTELLVTCCVQLLLGCGLHDSTLYLGEQLGGGIGGTAG